MDKYQKFGVFTLLLSLFLVFAFSQGLDRVLYISGLVYSAAFIFHKPIERIFISRLKKPLLAYALLVLTNGLLIETLAYFHNLPRIRAGEPVFLFDTSSLGADLLVSLPYYISFALIFTWLIKKYGFSTFEFTFMVGVTQALTTDEFTHAFALFTGGVGGILGFIFAGFIMLFTLGTPYVWFENKFREAYPSRNTSWIKFPIGMILQLIPLAITFAIVFTKYNILKN